MIFKKMYIFMIMFIFININIFSQVTNYPLITVDEFGNNIIIMTEEQAQKLDNLTDMLYLYESLANKYENTEDIYNILIEAKDSLINNQNMKIIKLLEINTNLEKQNKDLNQIILHKDDIINNLNNHITNSDKIIKEHDKKLKQSKSLFKLTSTTTIITILLLIILI